jgi:3'(2'),5'-bisphosphate nucleotidase
MPLPAIDYRGLTEALIPAALDAGRAIMRHYAGEFGVAYKADRSPVTAADQEAEDIILAALARSMPGAAAVAEEQAAAGILPEVGCRFFLVDPLDGTKEFIKRNGEFTVNIALVERGEPVFGIVYAPALNALYVTLGPRRAAFAAISDGQQPDAADFLPIRSREPGEAGLVAFTAARIRARRPALFSAATP